MPSNTHRQKAFLDYVDRHYFGIRSNISSFHFLYLLIKLSLFFIIYMLPSHSQPSLEVKVIYSSPFCCLYTLLLLLTSCYLARSHTADFNTICTSLSFTYLKGFMTLASSCLTMIYISISFHNKFDYVSALAGAHMPRQVLRLSIMRDRLPSCHFRLRRLHYSRFGLS